MTATCNHCESIFRGVDRNEDCAHPGCEVYLGRAGLSFQCEGCRRRFCAEHKLVLDGSPYCLVCAVAVVESQEPECECQQTDVDLFDAEGCEFHNPASRWNARLRAVTAIQRYEAAAQGAASYGERCEF